MKSAIPSTADNLNDMTWQERRRLDQREFNANRDSAQEHANANIARATSQERITEQLRRGGMLSTAEAGASFGPPSCDNIPEMAQATFAAPGRITVRDICRTLDEAGIQHTPATGRAAQLVRNRSPR